MFFFLQNARSTIAYTEERTVNSFTSADNNDNSDINNRRILKKKKTKKNMQLF